MVRQCVNLYENEVAHGTLFVSVDDSKFLIRFFESIKVEVLLDEEISRSDEQALDKNVRGVGKWGDYIDLSQLSFDQETPKTSQKVAKEDGQSLTVRTLDIPLGSDDKPSHDTDGGFHNNNNKKRKQESCIEDQSDVQDKEIEPKDFVMNVKSEIDLSSKILQNPDDRDSMKFETIECVSQNIGDILSIEKVPKEKMVSLDRNDVTATSGTKKSSSVVHSCRDCYATFNTFKALKDHKKVKSFNEYQCDECSESFEYQAFLEVHKKSNHGSEGASLVYKDDQYWYSCDSCGTLAKTLVKLQIHNMVHTGEGIFQCCRCQQTFAEKLELSQHMKNHKLSGMIRCRWCNKWFADKSALAKHKLKCKVIKCYLCDNVFPNRTSRNQHYKDFHPDDILKCDLCSYMFSSQEELQNHMVKHSKSKKKQCTLCGLFFSRLKKHMLVHKNPDEYAENEIFYCDKCPAKFTNQATFSRHRKNHLGDKPYQCPNCPRTFVNCGVLYKHIKRHKSLLPYTCEVCGKNCASIDQLKSHMKTHSDDNLLFPCSLCIQSFMYKNSLEAHMQMKHSQTYSAGGVIPVDEPAGVVKTTQDYGSSTVTSFTDNTLKEVVIPGISGLVEVVILQE